MWVFTASHVRKFSTESVGWKTPAPQLRPSQAKFLRPHLGCHSHLCVPQYTLSLAVTIKMQPLKSPRTVDDSGFPFNKLEEFWIMEQYNHLITNLFSNRSLEFVVVKSFLILLKITFNNLHYLNFPISAEMTSASSHKSLAWFDTCIPSYFLEDASYFIHPDVSSSHLHSKTRIPSSPYSVTMFPLALLGTKEFSQGQRFLFCLTPSLNHFQSIIYFWRILTKS